MISLDNKNSGTNSIVFVSFVLDIGTFVERLWNVCGTFVERLFFYCFDINYSLLSWLQVLRRGHASRKKQQNILLQPIAEVAQLDSE